jgi:hypothetical protein
MIRAVSSFKTYRFDFMTLPWTPLTQKGEPFHATNPFPIKD